MKPFSAIIRWLMLGVLWLGLLSTGTAPATAEPCFAPEYLYTGEQIDPDLGMYYLRARYYQPGLGRFWNMDSYEGSQQASLSLHKYLYCHGNPVNGVDPTGHDFSCISVGSSMSIMTQMGTHELRGGHAALVGARAMFGADGGVNDLIAGLDYMNIFDEKVGQVALGGAALLGGYKLVNLMRSGMSSAAANQFVVRFTSALSGLAKMGGAAGDEGNCAKVAIAFIQAHLKKNFAGDLNVGQGLSLETIATALRSTFGEAIRGGSDAHNALTNALVSRGNGSVAIVVGKRPGTLGMRKGHAFNAVNEGGTVKYYDLSEGGAGASNSIVGGLEDYQFIAFNP